VYSIYWAGRRFWLERSDRPAVEIDIVVRMSPHNREWLVFFDCVLTNKGRVDVTASPKIPALNDAGESLQYGASLLVRKLVGNGPNRYVDWFGGDGALEPVAGLEEINLVDAYIDPAKRNDDSFWLEPGETQHCGASVVLPAGVYLAKVTFVGKRGWDEFWMSIVQFDVPSPPRAATAEIEAANANVGPA
jgi:hypothetical protein